MDWLKSRQCEQEIQDQDGLDIRLLHQALDGLKRINFWTRSYRVLWPSIRMLAREAGAKRLSVLDIASGAGDIPIALWHRARREGLQLDIEGCDRNPDTVAYAQKEAAARQAEIRFFTWDALADDFPDKYDVVTCSLFLHHLNEDEAVLLLRRMAHAATRLALVNDLRRGAFSFMLVYLCSRLLWLSHVNRVDSLRSVRAAFTMPEGNELAQRADWTGATLRKHGPCRFLLSWKPT
jgi:SAM-dependent methyltransferase